ncbi:hypothetical protein ACFQGX_14540 [Nonomuraea dietziae]|uniref:hypothetical protein n=1 Tax=Nonomuraea dietziae TaxID=65515 RepID=UPI00361CDC0F
MTEETRLYLAAHPFAYPLIRLIARLGPVVRVPGVGVVVNDAAVARRVLMDPRFRKDGPGSPGDLWTPVLGPSVLLNMEGAAHATLRAKLAPLFTPSSVSALVTDVLAQPLKELSARLERGESVDLVHHMRLMAGAVICRVIGLGEISAGRALALFAEGERVASMVSLRTRRLNPARSRSPVRSWTASATSPPPPTAPRTRRRSWAACARSACPRPRPGAPRAPSSSPAPRQSPPSSPASSPSSTTTERGEGSTSISPSRRPCG